MIDAALLRDLPPLRDLAPAAVDELARRGELRRYDADATLWHAGMPATRMLIILDGAVRVISSTGGRQHVIHTETRGGTLGDVALFQGDAYPATAIAERPTTCAAFDRDAIHAAIRLDPELAFALLGRLAGRVRHLIERLDRLAARSVPARLAGYILERHTRSSAETFTLGRTQLEVAEELGTVREVVGRALRTLRDAGIIEARGAGRYRVVDEARLRRVGNGGT